MTDMMLLTSCIRGVTVKMQTTVRPQIGNGNLKIRLQPDLNLQGI